MQAWDQYGYRATVGWFSGWLGEALCLDGQLERARDVAAEGLEILRSIENRWGIASNQRVLGQIAHARHDLAEAQVRLDDALQMFASIQDRFDVGKTHLALAEVAHAQGNREAAATHLGEAHRLFTVLQAPRYAERTERLAGALGITRGN